MFEKKNCLKKMKDSLNEVMADKVPKMQKKTHKKWMTEEILNLMEDRCKAKSNKGTKGCTASNCIKAKGKEYIEDLFQDDRGEKPIIKKDMDGPPILKEEVSAAIRKMKHGKAVGPDNIPIEVFAVLEDIGIDFLTKLLNSILNI